MERKGNEDPGRGEGWICNGVMVLRDRCVVDGAEQVQLDVWIWRWNDTCMFFMCHCRPPFRDTQQQQHEKGVGYHARCTYHALLCCGMSVEAAALSVVCVCCVLCGGVLTALLCYRFSKRFVFNGLCIISLQYSTLDTGL